MDYISVSQRTLINKQVGKAMLIKDSIHKMIYHKASESRSTKGFTMTELLASITIVGILSTIAIPSHMNQVDKTKQNEAVSKVAQIQTTIATYADEFGSLPTSWKELNDTSAIMTTNGPANQNNFEPITLAGSKYKAAIKNTDNRFTIVAVRPNTQSIDSDACTPDTTIEGCREINFAQCVTELHSNANPAITQTMCGRLPIVACLNLTNGASDIDKIKEIGQITPPNCG